MERIHCVWKTLDNATNASSVYVDHTRGTTILDTKYMFTNDYVHGYWATETFDVDTPFAAQAGDVVYLTFIRRSDDARKRNLVMGNRWGAGNNFYIAFTPIPEPGMFIAALAGLGLLLRRK